MTIKWVSEGWRLWYSTIQELCALCNDVGTVASRCTPYTRCRSSPLTSFKLQQNGYRITVIWSVCIPWVREEVSVIQRCPRERRGEQVGNNIAMCCLLWCNKQMKNISYQDSCNLMEICELWVLDDVIEMRLIDISDYPVYKWGEKWRKGRIECTLCWNLVLLSSYFIL